MKSPERYRHECNRQIIGAGIGILLGVAVVKNPSSNSEGEEAAFALFAVLGGAYFGEKIDDRLHRTLYVAPGRMSVSIVPVLGRARAGLAAAMRF